MVTVDNAETLKAWEAWAKWAMSWPARPGTAAMREPPWDMVAHASRADLWHGLLAGKDPAALEWDRLPTVSRDDYESIYRTTTDSRVEPRLSMTALEQRIGGPWINGYQLFWSAGRTGHLTTFIYDRETWTAFLSAALRRTTLAGLNIRDFTRIALVGSSDPIHTLPRTKESFMVGTCAVFGAQDGIEECAAQLQAYSPQLIYGFSSFVSMLAKHQLAGRFKIHPEAVFVGTDTLSDEDRRVIRAAWGIEPLDAFACTEVGMIAAECRFRTGLHVFTDYVHIDEESEDTILVTGLTNRLQPILRYRLSDRISITSCRCECGYTGQNLQPLDARVAARLSLPSISNSGLVDVHPIVIRSALDRLNGVRRTHAESQGDILIVKIAGAVQVSVAEERIRQSLRRAGVDVSKTRLVLEQETAQ